MATMQWENNQTANDINTVSTNSYDWSNKGQKRKFILEMPNTN